MNLLKSMTAVVRFVSSVFFVVLAVYILLTLMTCRVLSAGVMESPDNDRVYTIIEADRASLYGSPCPIKSNVSLASRPVKVLLGIGATLVLLVGCYSIAVAVVLWRAIFYGFLYKMTNREVDKKKAYALFNLYKRLR